MSAEQQHVAYEFTVAYQPVTATDGNFRSCARRKVPLRHSVVSMLCIAVAFAVVWFVADQEARIQRISYRIDRLQEQVAAASISNTSLAAQVDSLAEPSRILGITVDQLHMEFASPVRVPASTGQK